MRSTKTLCDVAPIQTPPRPSLDVIMSVSPDVRLPGVDAGLMVAGVGEDFGRGSWMVPVALAMNRSRLYSVSLSLGGKSVREYKVPAGALLAAETSAGWGLTPVAEARGKTILVQASPCSPRAGGYIMGPRTLPFNQHTGKILGMLFGAGKVYDRGRKIRITKRTWSIMKMLTCCSDLRELVWRLTAAMPEVTEETNGGILISFPDLPTGAVRWFLTKELDPDFCGCSLDFARGFVSGFFSTGSIDRKRSIIWRKTTCGRANLSMYQLLQCKGEGLRVGLHRWKDCSWGALSIEDGGELPKEFTVSAGAPLQTGFRKKTVHIRSLAPAAVANTVRARTEAFTVLGSGLAVRFQ